VCAWSVSSADLLAPIDTRTFVASVCAELQACQVFERHFIDKEHDSPAPTLHDLRLTEQ
jgi:hypothetical protein